MGRAPCCEKLGMKKGPWTPEEDKILIDYIHSNGHGSWRSLPKLAGLLRCGKSCRLRWTNYLRPDIKRGPFTAEEQKSIVQLHGIVGNKWSTIAAQLPGRTDNEIKNYWNTHLRKRLHHMGGAAAATSSSSFTAARHMAQWESARLEAEARLSRESLLFSAAAVAAASVSSAVADTGPDYFLRMWNSDVGDSFRRQAGRGEAAPDVKVEFPKTPAPAAAAAAEEEKAAMAAGMDDSSGSNDVMADETSEETYQMYLSFAGDDLSFFSGQLGSFTSLFAGDQINEASLDMAF